LPRRGSRVQISSPAPFRPPAPAGLATAVWSASPKFLGCPAKARYPSGKGEVCKTFMRRFDPDPRLQIYPYRINKISRLDCFSTPIHRCGFFANFRVFSSILVRFRVGGGTKRGPELRPFFPLFESTVCCTYGSQQNCPPSGSVKLTPHDGFFDRCSCPWPRAPTQEGPQPIEGDAAGCRDIPFCQGERL
jgi:hypothetical protein